jgi:hypothetical protein
LERFLEITAPSRALSSLCRIARTVELGTTQKALARGVPVCVVPHGRDQFEVARRV